MNATNTPWGFFNGDMNGDGALTISDLLLWIKHAYFLPGDCLLWFLDSYLRPVARFLEVSTGDYGGFFSGFVSAAAWFIALLIIGAIHDRIVRLYLFAALRLRALRLETLRRTRVVKNRLRGKLWL
jgi:hypothetical protein